MNAMLNQLNILAFKTAPIFYRLLFLSLTAVCIGAVILFVRFAAGKKLPPLWRYGLWWLVLIALLVPYRPQSSFALLQETPLSQMSFREEYDEVAYQLHFAIQEPSVTAEEKATTEALAKQANILFWKSAIFDVAIPLTWLFGVLLYFIFLMLSKLSLSNKIKQHTVKTEQYHTLLAQCKAKFGIKAKVRVLVQDNIASPAMMGFFKPTILLPRYMETMGEESCSYMLLHELAHYKRKDMLVNYLLLVLRGIYWFNPILWVMFQFIREDMELCTDTYLLKCIGSEHEKGYARSLVEVLGQAQEYSHVSKLLCMADGKKTVERRITMIKLKNTVQKHKAITACLCLGVVSIVSLLFLTRATEFRQLTQSEIDEVNKAFVQLIPSDDPAYEYQINPICHFFTCYYNKPEEIDLDQLIWYFGSGEELSQNDPEDRKQFEALKNLSIFPFQHIETLNDMFVPIQRKSLASVNGLLMKYTGITVAELKNSSNVLYLDKPYDAFYTYASDMGAGFFNCTGGETNGKTIRLFSENAILTLVNKGGQTLIVSHVEKNQ